MTTTATDGWFFAAARTIAGPPMYAIRRWPCLIRWVTASSAARRAG